MSGRLPWRHRCVLFGLALLACLSGPNVTSYDSYLAVPVAWSVLRHGDLNLDEYPVAAVVEHHGNVTIGSHRYDFYPWPVALLAIPALAAAAAGASLGFWPHVDQLIRDNSMDPLQLLTAGAISALAAAVVAMVAFERLAPLKLSPRAARRVALLVGLLFVVGTTMWSTASRALWQHGPAALFLALALLDAHRLIHGPGPRDAGTLRTWARLGAWLALAAVMRPTAAVAGAAVGAAVLWDCVLGPDLAHRRGRHGGRSPAGVRGPVAGALGAAAVLAPFFVVNLAVFGTLMPTSYAASRLALHDHYLEALAANLVSPARGLLVSVPLVAAVLVGSVCAWRRGSRDPLRVACLIGLAAHWLVVSAGSFGWWAGHSYGARFFTEVTPLLAYLGMDLVARVQAGGAWRLTVVALAVASLALQVPGVYLRSTNCWNTDPVDIDADPGRIWSWDHPPFLHALDQARDGLPLRGVVLGPCPPPG